jgi:hypothetical protein
MDRMTIGLIAASIGMIAKVCFVALTGYPDKLAARWRETASSRQDPGVLRAAVLRGVDDECAGVAGDAG